MRQVNAVNSSKIKEGCEASMAISRESKWPKSTRKDTIQEGSITDISSCLPLRNIPVQITPNTHTPSKSPLSHLTVAIQSSSSSSAPCPAGPSLPQRRLTLRDWCQPRKAAVTGSLQNHPPDTADPPPPPPPLSRSAATYQLGLDASIATYVEKQKLSTSAFFRFAALRLQYGWRSSMTDAEWREAGLIYNDHFTEIKPVFYNTSFPLPRDEVERSVQTLKLHCADFERRISSKVASALADKSE